MEQNFKEFVLGTYKTMGHPIMFFLQNVELTEWQAKILLPQHVEGPPLAFIEAIINSHNVLTCLNHLLQYVKPSIAYVMIKLFQVKQSPKEFVVAFVIRFRAASLESGAGEERLKEAFMDALVPQWQLQASPLLTGNTELTNSEVIRSLCGIVGPAKGDAMKLGAMDSGSQCYGVCKS